LVSTDGFAPLRHTEFKCQEPPNVQISVLGIWNLWARFHRVNAALIV
jgi:hypothetical protein